MIALFLFGLKGAQLIVVALIVLLLFGTAKIPSMMRNLGKGVHAFKQGIEDAREEISKDVVKASDRDSEAKPKEQQNV